MWERWRRGTGNGKAKIMGQTKERRRETKANPCPVGERGRGPKGVGLKPEHVGGGRRLIPSEHF